MNVYVLKLEFQPLLIRIAAEGTRCPNELSSVCIKYLKAEILQAKKQATCHARKRTLNIYTSLYGAAEKATQSEHLGEGQVEQDTDLRLAPIRLGLGVQSLRRIQL